MTIYDAEEKEVEQIPLHSLGTKVEMHKLLVDKGFVRNNGTAPKATNNSKSRTVRADSKIRMIKADSKIETVAADATLKSETKKQERLLSREAQMGQAREARERAGHAAIILPSSPSYQTYFGMHALVGGALIGLVAVSRRRRLKQQQQLRKRNANTTTQSSLLLTAQ